ncbi:hypothetical protein C791_8103 [Amycolatopsis azurea DSM 43854]|uniref:Uncharacterized protein n=1 Tax=Amycolatopsis azurea DSM 43854 TaxID=1238180 RepID=M2Q9N2_9PSEU|nr:hypothetical protein C791_8103 [Amycolatopsis azurea DSM 43854]
MDEPHRGFSAVDDGDTTEHRLSLPSTQHNRVTSRRISRGTVS